MTEETRERLHHLVDRAANPERGLPECASAIREATQLLDEEMKHLSREDLLAAYALVRNRRDGEPLSDEDKARIKRAYGVEE